MMTYLLLFWEFFKTGLFAIGGGLATVPFLRDIALSYPEWYDLDLLGNMIAISESTPGPMGVNMATYVGYHVGSQMFGIPGGIFGGIFTTFGLVLPSVIIIVLISKALEKFKSSPLVGSAFYTIRPAVTGMIISVGITMLKPALLDIDFSTLAEFKQQLDAVGVLGAIDWKAVVLFAVLMVVTNIKKIKVHPIIYIIAAGVCGAVFSM